MSKTTPEKNIMPMEAVEMISKIAISAGVHPVCLDDETNGLADRAMRFMGKTGMLEKDERVILIENESTEDLHGTDSLKIISAR